MNIVYELLGKLQWGNWVNGVGIGECVFAIIVMLFIKQAEPIVRRIFGFDNAGSLGSVVASGALLMGSIKTASNAIEKHNKGNKKNAKSGSYKPQASSNAARNTNNINNSTQNSNKTSTSSTTNGANQNTTTPNNNSAGGQNGSGTAQNSNTPTSNSSNGGPNNTSQNNTSQNNTSGNRDLNTYKNNENLSAEEKKNRRNERIKKAIGVGAGLGFKTAGIAIGAFASDDAITGGMTGLGFGTALGEETKNLGGKAVGAGKKIANRVSRRGRLNKETDNLIDEYNKLKAKTGWSDKLMYNNSENLLNIPDLSKVSNPNLRSYGEVLHKYREEFEGKYQAPNDMVLNAIDKIQTGDLEKTDESIKRYTRKK